MWVDRYGELPDYDPEYKAWWRLNVAKEHQASYSVEWPDILPYLVYPHSDKIYLLQNGSKSICSCTCYVEMHGENVGDDFPSWERLW